VPAPSTTSSADRKLDLHLELLAQLDHHAHNQPINPDKTTNVILHPLFLLVRVFDNANPREGSGCLNPSLHPARPTRPHYSPGADMCRFLPEEEIEPIIERLANSRGAEA
jgi:hypothetical protein